MKDLFHAIRDFFVDIAFAPLDAIATLELDNWWAANALSFFFIAIAFTAFVYWMLQLKKHHTNNEEDKSISSHSYL